MITNNRTELWFVTNIAFKSILGYKHTHMIRYITSILFLICSWNLQSQTDSLDILDYSIKNDFEIGGIEIIGAESRDRTAIKSIAGLNEGDRIKIPGLVITKAVKSLLRLRLFEDVQIIQDRIEDQVVFLKIKLVERPTLSRYSFKGINKSNHDDLNDILKTILNKGGIITDDQKNLAKQKLEEYYIEKGRLDAEVTVEEIQDELKENATRLVFNIDRKDRIKVESISFNGNEDFSDKKLRKKMKNTKKKGTWFRKSKFIKSNFEEDKESIITFYNKKGYKDARIIKDSIWRDEEGEVKIVFDIYEGNPYFINNITWKGNSLYTSEQLSNVLGIYKGDIYNPELLENRLRFSQDGRDISSLYLDDGYLFFEVHPTEIAVKNDSIDIEMRIYEGAQATIENVTISGNTRTNEHVVRRAVRTRPGEKFSRSDIIRSQRELMNLGYFNPENMDIQTPVNPQRGTVSIEYNLEERPSDQLELSAGYGGASGLIGTLGVTFNNFSIANVRDRSTWSPLPQGDGQKLSLRIQSNSRFFRSYNFSFTEPWLGGKKPNSFTVGAVHSALNYELLGAGKLNITRVFAGLGTQLKWPDDFFSSSTTLSLENISLDNYTRSSFFERQRDGTRVFVRDGSFRNFSITQTITRSSVADPLFPRRGSRVSLSLQFTPPYSLFRDIQDLTPEEEAEALSSCGFEDGPVYNCTAAEEENLLESARVSKKYRYVEYHKWKFNAEYYFNVFDKLVFMTQAKFGFLGGYNGELGPPPFERFEVGGDGLSNQTSALTGTEIISLRGYDESEINNNEAGTVYNKITAELRYPLSLNPNSTIYVKAFMQGGNAWDSFSDFNPYDLNKSVGFGMRVFLPMFGLLGFDYGWGIDKNLPAGTGIGEYANFNIVLGFEPE